jgi:hypothetical protein
MDYALQTEYSDPGVHAGLYDALPDDIPGIGAVVNPGLNSRTTTP